LNYEGNLCFMNVTLFLRFCYLCKDLAVYRKVFT